MGLLHPGEHPPAPASTSIDGARIEGEAGDRVGGPGPFVMSCATLVSDVIENAQGEELGKLEHVMLDVPSGRVAYAVLARGGVLGLGARLFAIPWDAFILDAGRGCLVLDVARERLDAAPGFDHEHWPAMGDPAWAAQVREYFALPRARSRNPS